ncbi:hypothetical protein MC885_008771 [Smutsia gigantea]|nr:hypothetical protein MC885_008771 [Smutsia gigantea]
MASAVEELQKDLEEVKMLLEKTTRKRVHDALTAEKSKTETEIENKMQQKSQRKAEPLDNEKSAAVSPPLQQDIQKKAENTQWDYLTQVEKECKEKEKPFYNTETHPSEGLMNVLKKIYEYGDDDMK